MRVLYVTYHANALSESYIRTEIEWMQDHGVDVCMDYHLPHNATSTYQNSIPSEKLLQGKSLRFAIDHFKPNVIHMHWLLMATLHEGELRKDIGVPVTVRSHSFDLSQATVEKVAAFPSVKRIWAFPHLYKIVPKLQPLPVCFSEKYFSKDGTKTGSQFVMRCMAGVSGKNHEQWLDIARGLPDVNFVMVATTALPPDHETGKKITRDAPPNVKVLLDLQHEDVYKLMAQASLYLVVNPIRHPMGMPISIAQAMANGVPVVVPDTAAMHAYAGDGGIYFSDSGQARRQIRNFLKFADEEAENHFRKSALEQAKLFHVDNVLPTILDEWKSLIEVKT